MAVFDFTIYADLEFHYDDYYATDFAYIATRMQDNTDDYLDDLQSADGKAGIDDEYYLWYTDIQGVKTLAAMKYVVDEEDEDVAYVRDTDDLYELEEMYEYFADALISESEEEGFK